MARRTAGSETTSGDTAAKGRAAKGRAGKGIAGKGGAAERSDATAPAATTVLLVRHGQTATTGTTLPGRAKGLDLATLGHEQAATAARRIAGLKKIDAVYASPLERTRQTAAPIAKATGLRVRTAKGLLECDFGDWTGAKLADLRKLPEWNAVQRHPSGFRFPGGESFAEMQLRIWNELERLVAAHPGGTIVAVSHADPIKAAVADGQRHPPRSVPADRRLALFGHSAAVHLGWTGRAGRELHGR